ncbi:aspartate-semialdehyde dehydrogenase [Vibrio owensii]|uniref:aspartate-semialdehyde dehydrogenase n=1 Tax=Vibrio owensii TaxID=696485 RepID=UPI0018F1EA07|nr:aspartate-semialdehyde dehydrogenase [Vibrio owensii]
MITDVQRSLLADAENNDFAGFDPFDGLNANLFDVFPSLRNSIFGLAWIQAFKRSSFNMRHVLGVPKKRNPKGIGLFISGMLEQYHLTKEPRLLEQAKTLADWLLENRCCSDTWGSSCWGYHFDWKARAFFVPKGKPNVISTIYVSRALFELGKLVNDNTYIEAACSSAEFIVQHLYTEENGRQFFAYIPGETAFVHNASLWAAAWVGFVGNELSNNDYKSIARHVAMQSVSEQSSDGSWVYGARSHHQFIDGFHTGYNLEALNELKNSLQTNEFDESIELGLTYYKEHLFEADGTAKYYHNNRYPLDPHSVAQAVITLIKVGGQKSDIEMASKVLNWSIDELYLSDRKQFVYQKTAKATNSINYVRWTQAWMYLSMSVYLNYQQKLNNESN